MGRILAALGLATLIGCATAQYHPLDAFRGRYVGLTPSSSPGRVAETQVVISKDGLEECVATGEEVSCRKASLSALTAMTHEEIRDAYSMSDEDAALFSGFRGPDARYLFSHLEKSGSVLLSIYDARGFLGPTVLMGTGKEVHEDVERLMQELDEQCGEPCVPRLRYGGKLPQ